MENRFSLSPSKVFGKLRGLIDEYDSCVESEGDWPEDEEGILRYLGELEREQQLLCQLSRKLGNTVAQRRRLISFKMGLLLCDLEDLGIPPEQVERMSQQLELRYKRDLVQSYEVELAHKVPEFNRLKFSIRDWQKRWRLISGVISVVDELAEEGYIRFTWRGEIYLASS